jgi:hypothetical protein
LSDALERIARMLYVPPVSPDDGPPLGEHIVETIDLLLRRVHALGKSEDELRALRAAWAPVVHAAELQAVSRPPVRVGGRPMKLQDAEAPVRAALERLAESPRELRCFVVVEEPKITKRFVQLCTPPPPSRFANSPRIQTDKPLIFDGTGVLHAVRYEPAREPCDIDRGVDLVLDTLAKYLPPDAELRIVEESTQVERPS